MQLTNKKIFLEKMSGFRRVSVFTFPYRLAQASDVNALYEVGCMMEHSCIPNVKFTFDEKYHVSKSYSTVYLIF